MTFSALAIKYLSNLKNPPRITKDVEILNPYRSADVLSAVKGFCKKFYDDDKERIFVFGINPGRFGGGLTGISFTDPVALRECCKIENNLGTRKELSSKFVYSVVEKFGGAEKFFSSVFLTALYPFTIIKDGKNYNYYDDSSLAERLRPEIVQTIQSQIGFGARRDLAILLGKKNAEYFSRINEEHNFFRRIVVLEHPRYIMQYRLKKIDEYIKKYIDAINH
jgi:hypothetical protein